MQGFYEIMRNFDECQVTGELKNIIEKASKQVRELAELKVGQVRADRAKQIIDPLKDSLRLISFNLHSRIEKDDLSNALILAKDCDLLAGIIKDIFTIASVITEYPGMN
ncbi:MAG: hypothetical protein A2Y62_11820 [Candidatus Fischerbacteria bacterium RBG_13_37_8]|uniref:PhoU domain-containing protein n=1 Tax=Candidatus Fischerbacteria bacterium RBG_13_37_8 TaxID=1817863 RepID=A0A1F5VUW5_9BACT|nr:MAG: hypothetical protein A2Y62_11820 [Candidatus Fischerbacteria bacterium RBG_13_37_8]